MTVIAWDGNTLAADGLMTYGDSIGTTHQPKIFRASDYITSDWDVLGHKVLAFAITGLIGSEVMLVSILNNSLHTGTTFPAHMNFTALMVCEDCETWVCQKQADHTGVTLYRVETETFALGCGSDAALGAMIGGRNAIDAVAIAMDVNVYCGGGIQVWTPTAVGSGKGARFVSDPDADMWVLPEDSREEK
ncbi:TPA: hypothetical protein I9Y37_001842 [Citrobacter freundii]|nr:hypothetical protein [Citrobacter freundii]HAT3963820.1 hypothetical protein [Citrobacter freundii]